MLNEFFPEKTFQGPPGETPLHHLLTMSMNQPKAPSEE